MLILNLIEEDLIFHTILAIYLQQVSNIYLLRFYYAIIWYFIEY